MKQKVPEDRCIGKWILKLKCAVKLNIQPSHHWFYVELTVLKKLNFTVIILKITALVQKDIA